MVNGRRKEFEEVEERRAVGRGGEEEEGTQRGHRKCGQRI